MGCGFEGLQDFEFNDNDTMNTIEEAANGYILENYLEQCTMRQYIKDSFESGVEFAQRWIPATEEPEVNEFGFTEELLTKDERRHILQKGYKNKKGQFSWCDNNFVTHWRPIEIL